MLKMSTQVENIVNAYKTLAKIPSIVSGKLNKSGNRISSKWSVRNLDRGKTSKYTYSYILSDDLNVIAESDFGADVSNELLSAVSPKETFKAVIREEKEGKDAKKQYIEIWRRNLLEHSIDLTALDIHGDVYADSEFGSLDWSQDESAIIYIAEKKLRKSEPYIKRKGEEKPKNEGCGDKPLVKGEEFVYKQDWGEQLVGKHMSTIVMCNISDERVTVIEGFPETWCPGQVRFALDGQSVFGVAWETEPRRLGLIFCTNRPSFIFNLTLDGKFTKLSPPDSAVRSPRLGSSSLCWLQRSAGGPHHACHALVVWNKESKTLIPIVDNEMKISNGTFHGIYSQALPSNCFCNDGKRIVFSTPQQNEVRSYVVNTENGSIVDISKKDFKGSTSVLDVKNDVILAVCSSMNTPGELYIAKLPTPEENIKWRRISQNAELPEDVKNSSCEYLQLTHEGSTDSVKSFSALFFAPASDKKLPLVVWPHGGPHSGFVNAYSLEAALFSMLGFASLQINYRGSTGAGDSSVRFLLKQVGDTDVKDCKLATDIAMNKFNIDDKRLCLFGGSHGGFLVTHLSGQYPDLFKVVVSRNPVVDVSSMFNSTDIADWCAVEAGYEFSETGPVSEDQLIQMRRRSPLVHVHKVKAPTALMLGSVDKRVPCYQGLEYARRLKANGVETRVYMYDDNHSLSSLPAEMDNLINSVRWFLEHF